MYKLVEVQVLCQVIRELFNTNVAQYMRGMWIMFLIIYN